MKNNWLNYLLFTVVGIFIGALLFSKCGKAKVETHWETITLTDTLRVPGDSFPVPMPYPVWAVRDSLIIKTIKIKGDSIPYEVVVIKTIKDSVPILANRYQDSLDFSGKDISAKLKYKLITKGELLSANFDLITTNERVCPVNEPVIQKRLKNQIGATFGHLDGFYTSLDYTRNNFGLGIAYSLKTKSLGIYLRSQFRF